MSNPLQSQNLRQDALSGFMVFLIALPLCLGISMASGFPPVAGVLTAIVGGVVTSFLGGSPLTIKGPAAGLIVIALGAVAELGGGDPVLGYKRALAVGVVAAVIQIVFALLRAGALAAVMPPFVVHGMLAAIGVIIIAKQFPVMAGVLGAKGEPLEMLAEIPHYLHEADSPVLLLGLVSLAILAFYPFLKVAVTKYVPAPMVVLLVAVPAAAALHLGTRGEANIFGLHGPSGPEYLVALPGSLLEAVTFPDFSAVTSFASLKYIAMFALVGSIESLLSVIAVDSMDPEKRTSDLNRDLLATGIGNLIASFIGGLPMISEIVRSKANVDAGAKSAGSNLFHGLFLLLFVAAAPGLLQMIPLSALAAMLVITGARLASPKEFSHALHVGRDQLFVFIATCVVTLATDLLIGVAAGLVLKVVLHVARGVSPLGLFRPSFELVHQGPVVDVHYSGPASFTNLLFLRRALEREVDPSVEEVRVDFTDAPLIDHTTQEKLHQFAAEWPSARLVVTGLDAHRAVSEHAHASRFGAA